MWCCKNCEKRQVGCHSTCEDYLAQKIRNDTERAERNADNQEFLAYITRITKTKKQNK